MSKLDTSFLTFINERLDKNKQAIKNTLRTVFSYFAAVSCIILIGINSIAIGKVIGELSSSISLGFLSTMIALTLQIALLIILGDYYEWRKDKIIESKIKYITG